MFFGTHAGSIIDDVKTRVLDGQEYWVAPTAMMTEGVHHGSNGALFYSERELRKPIPAWNQKPITIGHPQNEHGGYISAANVSIIEKRTIGFTLNTRYDKKQRTESWINKRKAEQIEPRVEAAIKDGKMMEVSTGLFFDLDDKPGEWQGKQFKASAVNHCPDHLALLPDEIGACSIADGAGLLQVNSAAKTHPLARLLVNELSHGKIYSLLMSKLEELRGKGIDLYIMDVFPDYFVFIQQGKMYRMNYSSNDSAVEVNPTAVEVQETRTFVPVANVKPSSSEKPKMTITPERNTAITKLIANSGWSETDRPFLGELDDAKFNTLVANARPLTSPPVAPVVNSEATPSPAPAPSPAPVPVKAPMTMDEFLATAPDHLKPLLMEGQAVMNAQRATAITAITTNAANKLTPEALNKIETSTLLAMAEALTPKPLPIPAPVANAAPQYAGLQPYNPAASAAPNYGAAAPTVNAGAAPSAPMAPISYDFSRKA